MDKIRNSDVAPLADGLGNGQVDSAVASAMRFIGKHYREPINVNHVVAAASVSRRKLYYLFRRHAGTTIHRELLRHRLDRAKEMLAGTDAKLAAVASEAGFRNAEALHKAFFRQEQISTGEFRRRAQTVKNTIPPII